MNCPNRDLLLTYRFLDGYAKIYTHKELFKLSINIYIAYNYYVIKVYNMYLIG